MLGRTFDSGRLGWNALRRLNNDGSHRSPQRSGRESPSFSGAARARVGCRSGPISGTRPLMARSMTMGTRSPARHQPDRSGVLRRQVAFAGPYRPGTIVVMIGERHLYFVEPGGMAMRYTVGVGREEALNFRGNGSHWQKGGMAPLDADRRHDSPDANLCALHEPGCRAASTIRSARGRSISIAAIRTPISGFMARTNPRPIGPEGVERLHSPVQS